MPFQVSPGVNFSEIDLTTVTPAVSSTEGAIAGVFRWGPVDTRILIDSEASLVSRFGKPTNHNAETFFTAANFLSYGNKLYVVRTANTTNTTAAQGAQNAVANTDTITNRVDYNIKNQDDFDTKEASGTLSDTDVLFVAKWPGALGNSLKVSVCDSANAYRSSVDLVVDGSVSSNASLTGFAVAIGANSGTVALANSAANTVAEVSSGAAATVAAALSIGDVIEVGNSSIGRQYLKISSIGSISSNATHAFFTLGFENRFALSAAFSSNTVVRSWEFFNSVDSAPSTSQYVEGFGNSAARDELHVVVVDEDGEFTGSPGSILEVYKGLSRATDAKTSDGAANYYKTVINNTSNYVWATSDRANAASNSALNVVTSTNVKPLSLSFAAGDDGYNESTIPVGNILRGYDLFSSAEDVDVSLVLAGKARGGTNGEQIPNYIIDNVAESRRDCVVFVSPEKEDVVRAIGSEASNVVAFRNSLRSTSYAVLDSGYKYQYDKYNDVYRYVPLNGDIAGLAVLTDQTRDPWFSPAGFNRGQIRNIVKLAYNPSKADRDVLYKAGVNPVVTFPGQGTILFGDKTLLSRPSAFDRINVRRLFIVLEKAISTAAKSALFEFNDEFTRSQFKNLVEPFLRDVQGRRGITAFKVVCDTTNNTGDVIDRNEFVGDIYIKPAKSINFIQLNFVAVRTGVEFSEIVGQF